MNYVIGIDGGGTKTKLVRCTLDGTVIDSYMSGPSNILSSGYGVVRQSIHDVIIDAVINSGDCFEECRAMCIGIAGAARESVKVQLEAIIRETGYKGPLIITHDAETALIGGTDGEEGILLIAGTGTICYGENKEGKTHRVGGWGHIIGDEGSAYSIGVKILNAIMRAYDKRGQETILTELVLKRLALETVEDIIGEVYKVGASKQDIAGYAILIEEACNRGDEVALKIIDETIDALVEAANTNIHCLDFENKSTKVIINGSVLINNKRIQEGFCNKLQLLYPKVEVSYMIQDAAYGAAIKAIRTI